MCLLPQFHSLDGFNRLALPRGLNGEGHQPTRATPVGQHPDELLLKVKRVQVELIGPAEGVCRERLPPRPLLARHRINGHSVVVAAHRPQRAAPNGNVVQVAQGARWLGDVLLGISRQRYQAALFSLGGQGITDPTAAGRSPDAAAIIRRKAIVKALPAGNDGQTCLIAKPSCLAR